MLGQGYDTKEHFYVKKNRFFENLESKSPLKIFPVDNASFIRDTALSYVLYEPWLETFDTKTLYDT